MHTIKETFILHVRELRAFFFYFVGGRAGAAKVFVYILLTQFPSTKQALHGTKFLTTPPNTFPVISIYISNYAILHLSIWYSIHPSYTSTQNQK